MLRWKRERQGRFLLRITYCSTLRELERDPQGADQGMDSMATFVCLVIKGELEDVVKLRRRQARGHKCPFKVIFSFDMSPLAPPKKDRKAPRLWLHWGLFHNLACQALGCCNFSANIGSCAVGP